MAIYNGTPGNDSYTGTSSADTINGLAGNDILAGAGGNDITVFRLVPRPSATAVQDVPSDDSSTLYPRGNPDGPAIGAPPDATAARDAHGDILIDLSADE